MAKYICCARLLDISAPVAGNKIKLFDDGFMSPQQILGIVDAHRIVGVIARITAARLEPEKWDKPSCKPSIESSTHLQT
jgi:hypothetical protein